MEKLVDFLTYFGAYVILFLVFILVILIAVMIGITLRKRKNNQISQEPETAQETEVKQAEAE